MSDTRTVIARAIASAGGEKVNGYHQAAAARVEAALAAARLAVVPSPEGDTNMSLAECLWRMLQVVPYEEDNPTPEDAISALLSAMATVEAREREACAKIVEDHQEASSNQDDGPERFLTPRRHGNVAGLAYAAAIRAGGRRDV